MEIGVASKIGKSQGILVRKMTLTAALRWAWSEELPKEPAAAFYAPPAGSASAWAAIAGYGQLGSMVDRQPNRFGCIPFDRPDYPHADAVRIADAVAALGDCTLDVPAGWHPMPELATADEALCGKALADALERTTGKAAGGAWRFRTSPSTLIVRYAILGLLPDTRLSGVPERRYEKAANGADRWFVQRPVTTVIGQNADGSDMLQVVMTEADGWSARRRRPLPGAYRKPYLDPDPVPVMVARAEYQIMVAGLAMLFDDLAGRLDSIELLPSPWATHPWEAGGETGPEPKILPDLRQMAEAIVAANRQAKSNGKRERWRAKKAA